MLTIVKLDLHVYYHRHQECCVADEEHSRQQNYSDGHFLVPSLTFLSGLGGGVDEDLANLHDRTYQTNDGGQAVGYEHCDKYH